MDAFGGRRIRRWLGPAVVGLVALVAVATASASHPVYNLSSNFDIAGENWYAIDQGNANAMTWQASGGNPNGYITTTFANGGGVIQSVPTGAGSTWPAGNAQGDYGGTIAADVRVHLNGPTDTEDLIIGFFSSNLGFPACQDFGVPTSSWATYTVTLDTSHLVNCFTDMPLTGPQANAALAGFDGMLVGAGNVDNVSETVDVDNAKLTGPQGGGTPPTGNVARSLKLAYKGHKLSGTLVAADDYSCAGGIKLTVFEKGKKPVKVGKVTTSAPNTQLDPAPATFSFKLKKSAKGKFYVSAAKAASTLDGNSCVAATSKSVTVR